MKMFSTYDLAMRFAAPSGIRAIDDRAENVKNASVEDIEESEDNDDDRIEHIGNKNQKAVNEPGEVEPVMSPHSF